MELGAFQLGDPILTISAAFLKGALIVFAVWRKKQSCWEIPHLRELGKRLDYPRLLWGVEEIEAAVVHVSCSDVPARAVGSWQQQFPITLAFPASFSAFSPEIIAFHALCNSEMNYGLSASILVFF